jgi:hypothetical protein
MLAIRADDAARHSAAIERCQVMRSASETMIPSGSRT